MNIIDVVIPTYGRPEKLRRALASVHTSLQLCRDRIEVHVFYSDEKEYDEAKKDLKFKWLDHWMLPPRLDFRATHFWNHYLKTMYADALVYLTDDILLDQYCLLIAVEEIRKMSFDGVVGFNIDNRVEEKQPCLAAFGVIGAKFADRFPSRAAFCPDYYSLFADVELQAYAEEVKCFKFHEACRLVHFHPDYEQGSMDLTHLHTRRRVHKETDIYLRRRDAGLVWGKSFKRINEEDVK